LRATTFLALHPLEQELRALARAGDDRTQPRPVVQLRAETLEHLRTATRRANRELVKSATAYRATHVNAVIQQIQPGTAKPIGVRRPLDAFDEQLDSRQEQAEVDDRRQPPSRLRPTRERLARMRRNHRGLVAPRR